MPGTTAGGTPYALPDDGLVNWPTTSQQVAAKIDTKMDKSGGALTGFLSLPGSPTQALHAATKGYVDSVSVPKSYVDSIAIPVGGIVAFSGAVSIPANWAVCDGTRGTPDLRGKFILGASAGRPAGTGGGVETVTLNTSQMPAHTHGGSVVGVGNHEHTMPPHNSLMSLGGSSGASPSSIQEPANYFDVGYDSVTSPAGSHTHGLTIDGAGGNGAHENMPPYWALVYIMRVS